VKPENLVRQHDILPPDKTEKHVLVVGAGAIGSQVVMCLAKMGFKKIHVYDDDDVSEENISCQWYGPDDVGYKKVHALAENIYNMTGMNIVPMAERFSAEAPDNGYEIVISAVDSMKSRTDIFARARRFYKGGHFIDPRMSAEEGAIYTVNLMEEDQCEKYAKSLYTDEEGVAEACTAKATMYCSMLLSGQVAKTVKDIVVEDKPAKTVLWNIKKNDALFFQ
jgi:molybdopterin/thiamine biosynthesis adenylyltransferase